MTRILIIEDSPTQAQMLQIILEAEGFEVEAACDGNQGLSLAGEKAFDVIITDVVMPGISGYEVSKSLKTTPALKDIPVILLTTLSDPMNIVHGLECGADNFITKPYEPEYLVERIRSVISSRALRVSEKVKLAIEVSFLGKKFAINSDKEQILDLLISTFEEIVRANRKLELNQAELSRAKAKVEEYSRLLEGQVQISEGKYKTLMSRALDAIIITDTRGVVLEANEQAGVLLGLPLQELVGRNVFDFVPPSDVAIRQADMQRLLAQGFLRLSSIPFLKADRQARQMDLSSNVTQMGEETVLLIIARDVTEKNLLERQFHQSQKMEAVGLLAGGVAHDFNNLLTVINGYSELILNQRAPGKDLEFIQSAAEEIRQAGESAVSLTQQLLVFSRKQVVTPGWQDLNAIVANMSKLLQRLIGENINLNVELGQDLGLVLVDRGQMDQIIMNLVVNARDAMPEYGELHIETANVEVTTRLVHRNGVIEPGRYAVLSVKDTGCGIDEAAQERIFEPFFTTKEPGRGTGLGLATVFGIVRQAGGHILFESQPGRGTTFLIYFPQAKAAEDPAVMEPNPLQSKTRGGKETILIVEDDEQVLKLASRMLQNSGYNVLEARHGAEALAVCQERASQIHLVVTDLVMPLMGGWQLAQHISLAHPDLRMLVTSGYTSDNAALRKIENSAVAFLQKPYTLESLLVKVREILDAR